jgi:hypothetical protein
MKKLEKIGFIIFILIILLCLLLGYSEYLVERDKIIKLKQICKEMDLEYTRHIVFHFCTDGYDSVSIGCMRDFEHKKWICGTNS